MIAQTELIEALETLAPSALAESWDNVGWQVRCDDEPIRNVICSVDATSDVVSEASQRGANLILTHHPLLFRPLRTLDSGDQVGGVVAEAIRAGVSILSAHTNWDSAPGGVSWSLARTLDLEPTTVLVPADGRSDAGLGVIAAMREPIHVNEIASRIEERLPRGVMARVGAHRPHKRIALMGGSGSSAIRKAADSGATLYITADLGYHDAQEAEALGLSVLVVDHGASERPGMIDLAGRLDSLLSISVAISETTTSPWR